MIDFLEALQLSTKHAELSGLDKIMADFRVKSFLKKQYYILFPSTLFIKKKKKSIFKI